MRWPRPALVLLTLVPLVGCAGGGAGGDRAAQVATTTTSTTTTPEGGPALTVTLHVTDPVRTGAEVRWRVVVHNGLDHAVELSFSSGKRADVTLVAGPRTWRWSDGMMFSQMVSQVELVPGDTTFELVTDRLDLPVGDYQAVAELAAAGVAPGAARTITVVSG